MAERENPDLIVLDMMMPKKSGFLVLEKLKGRPGGLVPTIMITGNEGSRHRAYAEFLGALGTGTLVRTASSFGIRQLVKLVPVYGQTIGAAAAAAASFAATYAIGKAASYFLSRRGRGVRAEQVAKVYRETLERAFGLASKRQMGGSA